MNQHIKYVVGIGASAGGLEAIHDFFNHVPETNELTFIIAQHLSPDFTSMMNELLAHHTSMPILIVKHKMPLHAGTIYLIPAAFEARIENNSFTLHQLNRNALSFPINTLFESIAVAYLKFSIGIILSGTGSDGTLGMEKISQHGGLTMVQTPTDAKFADMPQHAIATKKVNCVLSVSEMPDVIFDYIHKSTVPHKKITPIATGSPSKYAELFHLLEENYTINFSAYKTGTLSRRIQRRMQLVGIDHLPDFVTYLKTDRDGLQTLYQDLLIGVTQFFRDKNAFALLETDVIPALFKKLAQTNEAIRIWINPCATGEEAYSVALLFKQYADQLHLPFSVKLFASDVSNEFIQEAKKGRYSYQSVAPIPKALLHKYFIKSAEYYEIIPEIRQKIVFTTHNVLNDPPFTKMDLVCCRNLLIYLNRKAQKHVTDLLRFSLNIGGFLFLGPSEGVASLAPDLIIQNQAWKMFKKTKRSNYALVPSRLADGLAHKEIPYTSIHHPQPLLGSLPLYAYNAILHDVVSSGFIIDASFTVLHTVGKARELLIYAEGVPTLILPKIIIDDLKGALITALHQAKTKLLPVTYNQITIYPDHANEQILNMDVHPIFDMNKKISYYWIRFDPAKAAAKKQRTIMIAGSQKDTHNEAMIIDLESELSDARVLLQSSIENMETVNEEMQSTNEELMASNEELQAANEELQSVNDELYTANLERSKKIDEISQAKNDIANLIHSAEICTIILNSKLEIRIFTPAIEKIFNLVQHDIGRPLKNFRHNLKFDRLTEKAEEVLTTHKPYELEIQNNQNHWYFLKLLPYYATQSQIVTGVVISLTDITRTKQLQLQTIELEKDLRLALKTGIIGVWHCNLKHNAFTYDETIKKIFGLDSLSCMSQLKQFIAAIHWDDKKNVEEALHDMISKHTDFEQKFRITRPNGSIRFLSCSANIHQDLSTESHHITGICWDMTEQYWLEEKIIDAEHLNLGLDAISDGWWDWDLSTQETYLSPLLKKTLGYDDHELSNQMDAYEQLILPADRQVLRVKMEQYIAKNSTQPMITTLRMQHKNGRIMWILSRRKGILNKQGILSRMIGTITNITELKESEAFMESLAYRDFLTRIFNKPAFIDAIDRAIARSQRNHTIFSVMYLDIDDFKLINDKWGHGFGDAVLCEVTNRLSMVLRTVDLLARLSGDEFGILVEDVTDIDALRVIATRYLSILNEPFIINDTTLTVTLSIGIAVYPTHGHTERALLHYADKAMYLAKKNGKNQFVL